MQRSAAQSIRRRRKQAGQAIIEFALAGLPFLALLVAAFDLSYAVFVKTAFRHAVREGVRFAATGRTLSGMGHDASIQSVVRANAYNLLNSAGTVRIRYYTPEGVATVANSPGNLVEVAIENYQLGPIGPIMRSGALINLPTSGVGAMEPFPGAPPAR